MIVASVVLLVVLYAGGVALGIRSEWELSR
jgi:hypothetical protein